MNNFRNKDKDSLEARSAIYWKGPKAESTIAEKNIWEGGRMEGVREGERFIKPSKNKIYIVKKVIWNGDWAVLREENGDHQILTSRESLRACRNWEKIEEDNF